MKSLYLIYALNTFLPSIFILFNLSTTIFVMGEYKENNISIPKILKIILLKMISIVFLQALVLHYVFENKTGNFEIISIMLGMFIIIETYFTHKLVKTLHSYIGNLKLIRVFDFEMNLHNKAEKTLKRNKILIKIICGLLGFIIGILLVHLMRCFSLFNIVVVCSIFSIMIFKYILYRTIKSY